MRRWISSKLATTSLLAIVFIASAAAQTQPIFHFTEKPGPHAVGLRVVEQYDYTRTYRTATDALGKPFQGERARPLQTLIWYPAAASTAQSMTVRDYTTLLATETSFGKPNLSPDWQQWIDGMKPTLDQKMSAVRDARTEPGKYPVVIYAPSFSAMSWENADLCEYLASFGYVVIASPDLGTSSRGMMADVAGASAQARDISFLIGYAQTLPDTDMSEVAVGGFSWGGISNVFAAARDNRIDALFALDGSARYYPQLVKQAADVHPEDMTIPLLFFTQGEISLEEYEQFFPATKPEEPAPNVLNAWTHGDLITVHDLALVHTEHSSMYQRNEDTWKGYAADHKGDYVRADGITGYAWIARYTLQYLNAYLKHDASAMAFLKRTPIENGAPPHLLTESFRAAKGTPVTLAQFRIEMGRQGFDHAADVYATMLKQKPDFKLEESALSDWATDLESIGHVPEAIYILNLDVQLHPDSSDAHVALADAYAKSGQKPLAAANYKKALEKNPDNDAAKTKLKALDPAASGAPK